MRVIIVCFELHTERCRHRLRQTHISSFTAARTIMHTSTQTDAQTRKHFNTYTGGHDDVRPCSPSLFVPTQLLAVEEEAGYGRGVSAWGSDCDDLSRLVPLGNV